MAKPKGVTIRIPTDWRTRNKNWREILQSVEFNEVDVSLLSRVNLNLKAEPFLIWIDVEDMIRQEYTDRQINTFIDEQLELYEKDVFSVDTIVSIRAVDRIITPLTNDLLKNI